MWYEEELSDVRVDFLGAGIAETEIDRYCWHRAALEFYRQHDHILLIRYFGFTFVALHISSRLIVGWVRERG